MNERIDIHSRKGRITLLLRTLRHTVLSNRPHILYQPVDKVRINRIDYDVTGFGEIINFPLCKLPLLLFKKTYTSRLWTIPHYDDYRRDK